MLICILLYTFHLLQLHSVSCLNKDLSYLSIFSSDKGSNFTAQCTQEYLIKLGCTPKFATPLNPRAMSLVGRLNANIKRCYTVSLTKCVTQRLGIKVYHSSCGLFMKHNETLGVSPYMMTFSRLPNGRPTVRILQEN